MNRKTMKRIMVMLVTLAVLYGCSSDDDGHAVTEKPVEPLTVSGAMDWYNASVGVLAKQKSTADSSDKISYKPLGDLAELFTDERWYAVESPLDFGDRNLMIMTPEVGDYTNAHGNGVAKQVLKLVVLRNKETGETYNFIMAVIPELDYMLRKGDELDKSTYLSPDSDLDGYIFFYTLDGQLINGRVYERGKVTGSINSPVEGKKTKKLIAYEICITYQWGQETGHYVNGEYQVIGYSTHSETFYVTVYVDNGIGMDPPLPPASTGGGGGGNTSTSSPNLPLTPTPFDDGKKPGERTDCTAQSEQAAQELEEGLVGTNDIKEYISRLRLYASSKSVEYGMLIDADNEGYINSGGVQKGTSRGINMEIGRNTVYSVHTHYNCSIGLASPSALDVYYTINAVGKSDYYEGTVIFACDGSEYYIHVEDYEKAEKLYGKKELFAVDSNDDFLNSKVQGMYDDIIINLLDQGYSQNYAHIYSMMSLLDGQDSGIKIYIKESASGQFKEIKVDKVYSANGKTYNYKLSKCK
ncbi:hypothetical protein IR083_10775 [Dysgonomonas sp. GY75]|uniref:hypothetical protein n=1 Tax=Dysgonomonas sp. GY75 TaxID=2780419 RepID=UPI001883A2ED|nr:hypothetical protein [Dysgonomonas sp. GY75]MBF0649304.1 hypothetical protein [Dysgonomonas sp. GY75]